MRDLRWQQLDDVFTRQSAFAAGLTRSELAWAKRSGRLLALRRGAYCLRATFDAADERARHRLHAAAALLVHDERHVLSHVSAAMSWGLPTPFGEIGRVTLTLPGAPASTDRQADLIVQVAELRPTDVRPWRYGLRTSVTRTAADCLRHLAAPDGVAVADAAVRTGRTTLSQLAETIDWQSGWPYAERGRAALQLVDGRRESPLESWSFVTLNTHGVPLPLAQVQVFDRAGTEIGRVDGWWPEHATVCEVDGRSKYSVAEWPDLLSAGPDEIIDVRVEAARRAIIREKVREDQLRSLGLEMVRWGTYDMHRHLGRVLDDIRQAWRRGDPSRVTGRLVQVPPPDQLAVESA